MKVIAMNEMKKKKGMELLIHKKDPVRLVSLSSLFQFIAADASFP